MPATQAVQAVLPVPAAHVPAAHVVQLEAPAALYEPAAQFTHTADEVPPVALYAVPATQDVQAELPVPRGQVGRGHVVQAAPPAAAVKEPAAQAEQVAGELAPVAAEAEPAGQRLQKETAVAPMACEYEPLGQGVQEAAPGADE